MSGMGLAVQEGVRVREKMVAWDAATARIAWYCVTLLIALAGIATVAPFALSPRGAEGVYWIVMGLFERVPSDVALANVGQALTAGEGLWAVPALLWALIALYMVVDAVLVFSAWLGTDMGRLGKGLARVRPALRWISATAMMILLFAGASELLLREGYTRYPDLWLQGDKSALPGIVLLVAGTALTPIAVFATARTERFLSAAVVYFGCKNTLVRKTARCLRAVCNGVVSWMLLSTMLVIGLVAYPVLLVAAVCVLACVICLWITIKMLPCILGVVFLHILLDRDI